MTDHTRPLIVPLLLVGLVLTSSVAIAGSQSASESATAVTDINQADTYVVEHGDTCHPIEPLDSSESVESFYDYRNHQTHPDDVERAYSSHGTTHLQEDDTSILFLHDGPDGLSLVMVHDQLDGDSDGGVADFDIVGLPAESEWVVKNDDYDSDTNVDEFHRGDGWASASWIWREGRTGGGAIQGGIDDGFAVTISPSFNEDARFSDDDEHDHPDDEFYDDGQIDSWELLSGDAESPDRIPMESLREPITLRAGSCEDPSVTYDRTDDGIDASVTDVAQDDRVQLQPTHGSGSEVVFDRLSVTGLDEETTFRMANGHPETPSPSPDGVESASHMTVTSETSETYNTTVAFSVERSWLDEQGLDPEDVALYTERHGAWNETETAIHGETDETYQYTAGVTTPTALTVAPSQDAGETLPFTLYGIGLGLAAGVILGLGWLVNAKRRSV